MTNRIALILVAVIAGLITLDGLVNNSAASLFLLRKFINLVGWVVFWR